MAVSFSPITISSSPQILKNKNLSHYASLDVQHCQNERGSAQASLHVRSGLHFHSSQIARETMTLLLCPHTHVYLNSFSALPLKKISTRKIRNSIRALSTTPSEMEQPMRGQRLMEFTHLLAPHKDLMVGLISAVDKRLHGHLLPSSASVPPDAEYYQNQSGASQGSLCINRGVDSSHIDFILTSWLHLSLPNGGAMDITNIQGYLKSSTDAPHFQFELVQCSPTYFIFFLDLIPRKDLVLHPDYLKTFYEDSRLEALRKQLETQVLEAKPYFSSSLYFRNVVSPTGILVSITCEDGGTTERAEEIIRDNIEPIANEVLELWMDSCVCKGGTATIEETERDQLEKRDRMIKSRAIEMDLSSSMPIQFGHDVADKILGVIRGVFRI